MSATLPRQFPNNKKHLSIAEVFLDKYISRVLFSDKNRSLVIYLAPRFAPWDQASYFVPAILRDLLLHQVEFTAVLASLPAEKRSKNYIYGYPYLDTIITPFNFSPFTSAPQQKHEILNPVKGRGPNGTLRAKYLTN